MHVFKFSTKLLNGLLIAVEEMNLGRLQCSREGSIPSSNIKRARYFLAIVLSNFKERLSGMR